MKTTELTLRLPEPEARFLETYAREHALSMDELFARYARRLQSARHLPPHPKNVEFTGSIPPDADTREAHRQHSIEKHR